MKQLIVMRTDLGMRKGKMIAQGAHASMKVLVDNPGHPSIVSWLDQSFTKIAVGISGETELLMLYDQALKRNMLASLIIDNGATEFNGVRTRTCIAIGPAPDEQFVGLTDHLKLL